MIEFDDNDPMTPVVDDLFIAPTIGPPGDGASDNDAQAFLQLVEGEGGLPTEEELQETFDKNFQNFSYLFLKGVFSYAEEELKKQ